VTHVIQGRAEYADRPAGAGSGGTVRGMNIGASGQDGVLFRVFPHHIAGSGAPPNFYLPEVDDEVVVAFEGGDPLNPIVVGSLWNAEFESPPTANGAGEKNDFRGIRSRQGSLILEADFDDAYETEHRVFVLENGVETGSWIIFGDGEHGRRIPSGSPPPTPDGVVQMSIVTPFADENGDQVTRVKVKFPWIREFQSPDGLASALGDEIHVEATRKSGNESSAVSTCRVTGFHLPDFAVADVLSGLVACGPDVTTTNANPGDIGYGAPDGAVNGADLSYFVEQWLGGNALVADVTTTNENPGDALYGVPDGGVNGSDLSFFVELWLGGCQ